MSSEVPLGREHLYMNVELAKHPVAAAQEADASDAARRYAHYIIRGPLFGIAAQDAGDGHRWRVLTPVACGFPQDARDRLNSALWLRAEDDTEDRAVRRELLAAVARLETEPVDEVTAAGTRYRVVRCEEIAYGNGDGPEPPRPTDPEPAVRDWEPGTRGPDVDAGFVIDHIAAASVMETSKRLALMGLHYRSPRYPAQVRADSPRALRTHAGISLLPTAYRVLERTAAGWQTASEVLSSPHAARRALVHILTRLRPAVYELPAARRAGYERAAAEFRAAGDSNAVRLDAGRELLIVRMRRLVRIGPDGPESARPSDEEVDGEGPTRIHPAMAEDGTITQARSPRWAD
ncbi:DUF5954 family protein [Streptomyces sp. H34-S4]|uniref:DUF5954 family protein n=1 Tax=Streptomyces sp. H34-S4 TaxID=2996463 RepID=UPI00226FBC8D|nr:DUF5954 family protein [Streptomyces sp. H34-S4]MCY0934878.1 DUF5954 family protein [Streptomyces sp. H34-S4]